MRRTIREICLLAAALLLVSASIAAADFDDEAAITGVKAGYNFIDPFLSNYEEHTDVSVYHVAAYGGYDFGIFSVTGTAWNYFISIEDGIWRVNGQDIIDQAYFDAGGNGAFGITGDILFDIVVAEDVVDFTPGIGIGFAYIFGDLDQYDYQTNGAGPPTAESDLEQYQVDVDPDSKSELPRLLPLVHVDLDWRFHLSDNWFATVNLGLQTFGFNTGAGVGYHF